MTSIRILPDRFPGAEAPVPREPPESLRRRPSRRGPQRAVKSHTDTVDVEVHPDRHQAVGHSPLRRLADMDCATHHVDDVVVDGRAVPHRHDSFQPEHLSRWIFEKVEQGIGVDATGATDGNGIRMEVVMVMVVLQIQKRKLPDLSGRCGGVEE